jgi:hypothetical protein
MQGQISVHFHPFVLLCPGVQSRAGAKMDKRAGQCCSSPIRPTKWQAFDIGGFDLDAIGHFCRNWYAVDQLDAFGRARKEIRQPRQ